MTDESERTQSFSRMQLDMEIVKRDVNTVKDTLDKLCIAILGDGNGRPGIVRQIDAIKSAIAFNDASGSIDDRVSRVEADIDNIKTSLTWIQRGIWTFAVAFILFFASFVWSVLTQQIRIQSP